MYLKRALKQTLKSIKENKKLFVLLVVLQLIFVVSIIGVSIFFQIKIFDDAKGIIEPLQNANYDANSIEEGTPFTKEMIDIYQNYVSMRHNVIVFVLWLSGLFVFLNGSLWVLTHGLLKNINLKNYQEVLKTWLKFILSILLIMGPFLIVSYYLLISLLRQETAELFSNTANILKYSLLALYYLIIVAFAVIYRNSWKKFAKEFYKLSILNIFKSVSVLAINLAIMLLLGYGVYISVNGEEDFVILIIISLLFIIGLVFTRIFWIASIKEITNETNNN